MASANGKAKDGGVTDEQLKAVEYELERSRTIEENNKRLAAVRETRASMQEVMDANRHTKKKRLNQPKIHIPFNVHGQPIGPDATEFTNFIGTLVRKHIPLAEFDWRDVDEEKNLLVWETLKAFYELDSTALSFVINTSHLKWKDWKANLKRCKFDAALTDAQLMKKRDDRISEADWKKLIEYWRSPEFESRSAIAKQNRANAVPHTSGSKSHARVSEEMAIKLGQQPQRDQVYIETHTCKKGDKKGSYVPQAASTILIDKAEEHPDWKEKSIEEGDLFARVCGMKEPRGRVRVLGLGPTPQDLGTPGTRGRVSTRLLVQMEGRRIAENRFNMLEGQMQQMQQQMNRMEELLLASQGGRNLETPSSHHGSNSRQNSRVEDDEDNDGEDDDNEGDDEEPFFHKRVVAKPPARSSSTHEDESLIGMDVLLYAWTGPKILVAKATIISIDQDTIVGAEPLGPATYEVIVNVVIKRDATLPNEYDGLRFVADAVTRSIAWPSSKLKPYKPGASSSSRR